MTKKTKDIILSIISALLLAVLIFTAIVLTDKSKQAKTFSGTVVDVTAKKKLIAGDIIEWNSNQYKSRRSLSNNSYAKSTGTPCLLADYRSTTHK